MAFSPYAPYHPRSTIIQTSETLWLDRRKRIIAELSLYFTLRENIKETGEEWNQRRRKRNHFWCVRFSLSNARFAPHELYTSRWRLSVMVVNIDVPPEWHIACFYSGYSVSLSIHAHPINIGWSKVYIMYAVSPLFSIQITEVVYPNFKRRLDAFSLNRAVFVVRINGYRSEEP